MKKRENLICKGCGNRHFLIVDTESINPRKLVLNACNKCPKEIRRKEFKAIEKRGMPPKKIKVKEIPEMEVLAEIKSIEFKDINSQK